MNKLLITKWNGLILTVLLSDAGALELSAEPDGESGILGNIYIGKVKRIIKNINAAFVEYEQGNMGFYSLTENTMHNYTQPGEHKALKEGDEILVQVSKDAVKTKDPVLSSLVCITGKYLVLTHGKGGIGFSQKLYLDDPWKASIKPFLEAELEEHMGFIVRTNARTADKQLILDEIGRLKGIYQKITKEAPYRTCYSLLYHSPANFIKQAFDSYSTDLETIITDEADLFQALRRYMNEAQPEDLEKLQFYQDHQVSLFQLYRLKRVLEEARNKQVWLKSGGYLVIEPTEALTVIDVNTGKYSGKKNVENTIRKINLEASEEIARQLRLRNLTGIIIVDFIDMKCEEYKKELMQALKQFTAKDPIKTTVIDMTALNLVEITRKKGKRPLEEQLIQERL